MTESTSNAQWDALKLRTIILNARQPFVLRNFNMKWKCFDGVTMEEWCTNYDKETNSSTEFETMSCDQGNQTPHWERERKMVHMTLSEFLQKQKSGKSESNWFGLNYRRIEDMPLALREGINFSSLGFSEASKDCNYWFCSKQTNTPCHYDTYGCNIVVQVYGRKSWLLFPPKTPLTCTRIPYEESSIYCEENLFAPSHDDIQHLIKLHNSAYRFILEANDVLIVPRHWWHYVEAMDISLSVNYWIPLEDDIGEQLQECIVKILIERFVKNFDNDERNFILNPNQIDELQDDEEIFEILHYLYEKTQTDCSPAKSQRLNLTPFPYQYLNEQDCQKLINELSEKGIVKSLTPMPKQDYESLLNTNSQRFRATKASSAGKMNARSQQLSSIKKALLNSICAPTVIENIKKEFFKRYQI